MHVAAFSDEVLHAELAAKSSFWQQPSFYGVDLTPLHAPATAANFGQASCFWFVLWGWMWVDPTPLHAPPTFVQGCSCLLVVGACVLLGVLLVSPGGARPPYLQADTLLPPQSPADAFPPFFLPPTLHAQVVVDQIPPHALVSNCASKTFDFMTCGEGDLQDVVVPLSLQVKDCQFNEPCIC